MAKIVGPKDVDTCKSVVFTSLDDNPGLLVQTDTTLLYGYEIANGAAALTYVQCFDAAALTDVSLGTTVPNHVIVLTTSASQCQFYDKPIRFSKGLVIFSTNSATGSTAATTHGSIIYA